jgi:hypothetical protein
MLAKFQAMDTSNSNQEDNVAEQSQIGSGCTAQV